MKPRVKKPKQKSKKINKHNIHNGLLEQHLIKLKLDNKASIKNSKANTLVSFIFQDEKNGLLDIKHTNHQVSIYEPFLIDLQNIVDAFTESPDKFMDRDFISTSPVLVGIIISYLCWQYVDVPKKFCRFIVDSKEIFDPNLRRYYRTELFSTLNISITANTRIKKNKFNSSFRSEARTYVTTTKIAEQLTLYAKRNKNI